MTSLSSPVTPASDSSVRKPPLLSAALAPSSSWLSRSPPGLLKAGGRAFHSCRFAALTSSSAFLLLSRAARTRLMRSDEISISSVGRALLGISLSSRNVVSPHFLSLTRFFRRSKVQLGAYAEHE